MSWQVSGWQKLNLRAREMWTPEHDPIYCVTCLQRKHKLERKVVITWLGLFRRFSFVPVFRTSSTSSTCHDLWWGRWKNDSSYIAQAGCVKTSAGKKHASKTKIKKQLHNHGYPEMLMCHAEKIITQQAVRIAWALYSGIGQHKNTWWHQITSETEPESSAWIQEP